jgi:hypothetical protein
MIAGIIEYTTGASPSSGSEYPWRKNLGALRVQRVSAGVKTAASTRWGLPFLP